MGYYDCDECEYCDTYYLDEPCVSCHGSNFEPKRNEDDAETVARLLPDVMPRINEISADLAKHRTVIEGIERYLQLYGRSLEVMNGKIDAKTAELDARLKNLEGE